MRYCNLLIYAYMRANMSVVTNNDASGTMW